MAAAPGLEGCELRRPARQGRDWALGMVLTGRRIRTHGRCARLAASTASNWAPWLLQGLLEARGQLGAASWVSWVSRVRSYVLRRAMDNRGSANCQQWAMDSPRSRLWSDSGVPDRLRCSTPRVCSGSVLGRDFAIRMGSCPLQAGISCVWREFSVDPAAPAPTHMHLGGPVQPVSFRLVDSDPTCRTGT